MFVADGQVEVYVSRIFVNKQQRSLHTEKYFDMKKNQCKEALEIYKTFLNRMTKLSEFLKVAEVMSVCPTGPPLPLRRRRKHKVTHHWRGVGISVWSKNSTVSSPLVLFTHTYVNVLF